MPALRALGALHWRHQVMTKLKAFSRSLVGPPEAYAETRMQGRRLNSRLAKECGTIGMMQQYV